MTEATQSGADLQSAAKAISGLMSGGDKKQPEESHQEAEREDTSQESSDDKYQHRDDDSHIKASHDEPDDEDTDEGIDQETEAELPSYLDQLAQSMNIDPAKLQSVKVKTKIDGQDGEATIGDLIKSYQLEGHLNKKSMAMSEQQKALENEVAQQRHMITQQMQQLHGYSQFLEAELFKDYQSTDWNALREYNPAEFAAKQLDFQTRRAQINGFNEQVAMKFREESTRQQQESARQQEGFKTFLSDVVKQEQDALLSKIPEWKTPEKLDAGQKELRGYLKSQGFDDEDLNSVIDHRYVLMARKAMLYDKVAQTKPDALNKVKKLPTFIKQSGTKSKADIRAEKRSGHIKQLRKSGSVKDAAAALFDIL